MSRGRDLGVLLVIAAVWGSWHSWHKRDVYQSPGILAPDDPVQEEVSDKVFQSGDYRVEAKARYRVKARILSREDYSLDAGAGLAPMDLALGWGPMSDSAILDQMTIAQSARFYSWHTEHEPPLPSDVINRHAANTHLIPANGAVLDTLHTMRRGQVVELEGYLVNATRPDGWHWNSSLSREDSGAGACELLWVERARVI